MLFYDKKVVLKGFDERPAIELVGAKPEYKDA